MSNLDWTEAEQTVVNERGETRACLRRAFEMVENREHWKLPIDATLTNAQLRTLRRSRTEAVAMIDRAVVFFTGSKVTAKFTPQGVRITAAGYYAAVGA